METKKTKIVSKNKEVYMPERNEIKDRILIKAKESFFQFGFTKTNVGDIATNIGISKKTLYKYFPSKEAILRELVSSLKRQIDSELCEIWSNENMDYVEKLKKIMNVLGTHISKLRGPLLEDLRKNIPEIWEEINQMRLKTAEPEFTALINEGVQNKVFRDDIYQRLTVLMYINAIQGMINPEVLSQLPLTADQVFETIIKILFEGILTTEGREKYCSLNKKDIGDQ